MANEMIKFLRGNVANLPATATAGAVYFTKDEGLYLGLEDGTYHRYGDFITVANVDSLPAIGAHETCMYYCEAENILAKWNETEGKWIQINKQKTLAELGGVAKSVYEAKMAALENADIDNATATANLATYVGTIPETATATNIVAYVQEKTAGIATSDNLQELAGRVTTAEGEIDTLQTAIAEGGSVANAIADAKAAGDAAQADVDALEAKVGTVAEGKTVVGLIETAQAQADKGVADAATAQAKADSAYTLAEGRPTMEQVNAAIAGAGHAVKADVDQAISDMDAAYKKADADMKAELEGKINAKVAQADYDAKVAELEGADDTLQGNIDALAGKVGTPTEGKTIVEMIADAQTAATYDDTQVKADIKANADAIDAIEADYLKAADKTALQDQITANANAITLLTNGVSADEVDGVNDLIKYVKEHGPEVTGMKEDIAANAKAIADQATSDAATYETKTDAAQKLTDAKAYADGEVAKLAQADADNLAAAKKYTDDEIAELNIAQYAKQADVDTAIADAKADASNKDAVVLAEAQKGIAAVQGAVDTHAGNTEVHITAAERTAWNAAEKNAKDYADGLNATMNGRVEALEAIDHEHANKAELDKIADGDVAKWNAAQANAEATAAAALAGAKTELEGKITSGDSTTLASAQAYADTAKADAIADAEGKVNALAGNVYTKAQTYTQAEVDALITAAQTWGEF